MPTKNIVTDTAVVKDAAPLTSPGTFMPNERIKQVLRMIRQMPPDTPVKE
jgi:hypothetical protein